MYESGENYLETILVLTNEKDKVRAIDVAKRLNYSKPSVSRAMKLLKEDGYIDIQGSGDILLTSKGHEKANEIYERHQLLTDFLTAVIGVNHEVAEEDACKIEHIISQEVFHGIKDYMSRQQLSLNICEDK